MTVRLGGSFGEGEIQWSAATVSLNTNANANSTITMAVSNVGTIVTQTQNNKGFYGKFSGADGTPLRAEPLLRITGGTYAQSVGTQSFATLELRSGSDLVVNPSRPMTRLGAFRAAEIADIQNWNQPYMKWAVEGVERMRMYSETWILGGTQSFNSIAIPLTVYAQGRNTTNNAAMSFRLGSTSSVTRYGVVFVGHNSGGGGQSLGRFEVNNTTVQFVSASDYRKKTDIQPLSGALALIDQLRPCAFNYHGTTGDPVNHGFIAHELQEVVPDAVQGDKDQVSPQGKPRYQKIDQTRVIPLLTAGLKELRQQISQIDNYLTLKGT